MSTYNPMPEVEVIDAETGYELAPYGSQPLAPLDWRTSDTAMLHMWYSLRDAWLALPKGKNRTNSAATLRAYSNASREWVAFLDTNGVRPWQATNQHVRAWIAWLTASGMAPATVNQKLSAVSSWYSFIIREKHLVDGREVSAFMDIDSHTRDNPFKTGNIGRPHVDVYDKAHPLTPVELNQLFTHLLDRARTVTGLRNYALILGHFLTGSRASELCRLTWGDIRPNTTQPGSYVFAWKGKGNKSEATVMPARVYHAIEAYLRAAGRILPGHEADIDDKEYIFRPISVTGLRNLPNLKPNTNYAEEHITARTVQRVFQGCLKAAGIKNWRRYRVHDLRHSFAIIHYEATKDLKALRGLLHHSSIATTDIYIRHLQDPRDTHSEILWQQLGF